MNITEQPDRRTARDFMDQSTSLDANASLAVDPDSVDFNLTEEASLRRLESGEIKLFDLPSANITEDSGKTDDVNVIVNDEINKIDNKVHAKDEESNKEPENAASEDDKQKDFTSSTIPFTSHEMITVSNAHETSTHEMSTQETNTYETTTNSLYKKRPQKLQEDEMKICLEIDELNVRKCYIQIPNVSNFVHSRNYCETHFAKGKLITINSPDEQQFLILNSVYYFWTAFKVRLGLTSSLTPYIAAIRPVYKQSNASVGLIEKFKFNQNLVVSETELKEMISDSRVSTYPTNDDDSYEEDDIRLEETEPIFVLVPKVYCLEASLNFENGQPLFKWVAKDCDQETSSSVCELSEPLEEEEDAEPVSEQPTKPESGGKSEATERPTNKLDPQQNELVNEQVNQLISQFLSGSSNKTKSARPQVVTEPTNIEFRTESAEDERFREILSDLLKEVESSTHTTTIETLSSTQILSTTLPPESTTESTSVPSTTPLILSTTEQSSTELSSTELSMTEQSSTKQPAEQSTMETTTGLVTVKSDEKANITVAHRPTNSTANCTAAEQNPLIYQLMFAVNIAFNSFCSLVSNLVSRETLNEKELKHSKLIFLSAIILLLLLLLITVLLIVLVTCRYAMKALRRKRRLLLDTLSEQKYKKEEFNVAIDKKYDDCYYNIPHNRNIYVSNPESRQYLLPNNNEKYKSIPKEYFY